jgi:hypothetical protein
VHFLAATIASLLAPFSSSDGGGKATGRPRQPLRPPAGRWREGDRKAAGSRWPGSLHPSPFSLSHDHCATDSLSESLLFRRNFRCHTRLWDHRAYHPARRPLHSVLLTTKKHEAEEHFIRGRGTAPAPNLPAQATYTVHHCHPPSSSTLNCFLSPSHTRCAAATARTLVQLTQQPRPRSPPQSDSHPLRSIPG